MRAGKEVAVSVRLSVQNLDLHIVKEDELQILVGTCDEVEEWIPLLAEQLQVRKKILNEMLDELRIFFVLARIYIRMGLGIPGFGICQPPPQLERLWKQMSLDARNCEKFVIETRLPDIFRFQDPYQERHRIDGGRARLLLGLAPTAGLPVNERYWRF